MEEFKIEGIRWYAAATADQIRGLVDALRKNDSKEILIVPSAADQGRFTGFVLAKYYTPALSEIVGVRDTTLEGDIQCLSISAAILRGFFGSLSRKLQESRKGLTHTGPTFDELMEQMQKEALQPEPQAQDDIFPPEEDTVLVQFLKRKTPERIEAELNETVIGQPELTKAVADFLYYHALRQLHPQLPQRPLLIAGPSGSGKTEVWRVAARLYGNVFPIRIIDGSSMSCEGWGGNYKIDTYMDASIVNGGILVVDEFDKLTKPKFSGHGENVSLDLQAEFLKLVEGEYCLTDRKKKTNMTSRNMGFVLVGAFESLRREKDRQRPVATKHIGFCAEPQPQPAQSHCGEPFTDEDFIAYGIIPELVGRIAIKCGTHPLSDADYMNIICGPNSRVALIRGILESYGMEVCDLISPEELRKLVATTKTNQTGVRWVSAQVENRLLEAIRQEGIFPERKQTPVRQKQRQDPEKDPAVDHYWGCFAV